MSHAPNYLEALAGIQPKTLPADVPLTDRSNPPSNSLGISNEPAGELAQPGLTNGQGERVSPELLVELKSYIEQCVVETVSGAMTTIIPDVVEQTMSRMTPSAAPMAPAATPVVTQPSQAPSSAGITHRNEVYETPVPTMHTSATSYRRHGPADWACWLACGGIVVVMAGLAAYSIKMSPQSQTVNQNHQLTESNQALTERLVESNQQVLDSRQRCGNFSLICNIKE